MVQLKNDVSIITGIFLAFMVILTADLFSSGRGAEGHSRGFSTCRGKEASVQTDQLHRKKLEELSASDQERARRLGYKNGDTVDYRIGPGEVIVVLPPLKEGVTSEAMREKLLSLIFEKIIQPETFLQVVQRAEDFGVEFMLNLEGKGTFTVQTKARALSQGLQKDAEKLGFAKDDMVQVVIDSQSWEYHIIPKAQQPVTSFIGSLLEVIPSQEPGGKPSLKVYAEYGSLRKDLMSLAKKKGYKTNQGVLMIFHSSTETYEILPPPIEFASGTLFEELDSADKKAKALKLGYKEGDTVWFSGSLSNIFNWQMVSRSAAGDGPIFEIRNAGMENDAKTGNPYIYLDGLIKFEYLPSVLKEKARIKGYKEGSRVQARYKPQQQEMEIE